MNVELINFFGAKNVEFEEFAYVEEIGEELPIFTLTDIPADEWNRRARVENTKMFLEVHNRQPIDYAEVLAWVWSLITPEKEKVTSGN